MQPIETIPEQTQMLDLARKKEFKLAILNVSREIKEIMSKKPKGKYENDISPNGNCQ